MKEFGKMPTHQQERDANQAQAEAKLSIAVSEIAQQFNLTTAEVCVALSGIQLRWAGYVVRDERELRS